MAKNNSFIEARKRIEQAANRTIPTAYAAFAITLHQRGWSFEEIEGLFFETQAVWNKCTSEKKDMLEKCFEETGIDLRLR